MNDQLRLQFIATGGTISGLSDGKGGYKSGQLNAVELLGDAATVADWDIQQPYKIGSQHATLHHFASLGDRLNAALLDEAVDGVLISHGTDTLEELMLYLTARFGLLCKPVVLVASMRPADHPEADGPTNLASAVNLLQQCASCDRQLLLLPTLVMANHVTVSIDAVKRSASSVNAFTDQYSISVFDSNILDKISDRSQYLNQIVSGCFGDSPSKQQSSEQRPRLFDLSRAEGRAVEVVYVSVGMQAASVMAIDTSSTFTCIVASPGNASLPDYLIDSLEVMVSNGVRVVIASRLGCEGVASGFEANRLSPKLSYAPSGWSLPQVVLLERLRIAQV